MRNRIPKGVRTTLVCLSIGSAAVVLAGMVSGCGEPDSRGDTRTGSPQPQGTSEIVQQATSFGGIIIPDNAEVLDARTERGLDTMYRVAIRTDPAGVDRLLKGSKVTATLNPTFRVTEQTIAGPPLDTSPALRRTEDEYQGGDGKTVYRIFLVDERDQTTRYVHIQLFHT